LGLRLLIAGAMVCVGMLTSLAISHIGLLAGKATPAAPADAESGSELR
jgi:hypothetical protein